MNIEIPKHEFEERILRIQAAMESRSRRKSSPNPLPVGGDVIGISNEKY